MGMALLGGALIGLAASMVLLGLGKIMGISGMLRGLFKPQQMPKWQICFVVGVLLAPWLLGLFGPLPEVEVTASVPLLVVAGLLVGFGASMGSGCTSGHSVCGMARTSPRSVLVTVLFMLAGAVTVYLLKHVWMGV
ncbi:MAG: YeeE/YedE family protein [Neisseriaceae bacterium]|nr:YeeE/YedE family protein [Neisseriaceae bacterium]MBP6863162.1 YeeE/YedE family protein [Neisseriaceae bacterium]